MLFLRIIALIQFLLLGTIVTVNSQSKVIYVSNKSGNDINNGSQNSPFKTIDAALNIVNSLDTILVAPGIYIENLNFQNKVFILKSEKGPDSTILTSSISNVIRISSTVNTPQDSIAHFREIYGFTISTKAANAIYTDGGTRLKITNCIFKENNAGYGAIHNNAVTTFQNCLFVDNIWALCLQGRDTTAYGGGEVFINCVFTRNGTLNTCDMSGNWKPKFINCIIVNNNGGKSILGQGYEVFNSIIDDDLYSKQLSNLNIDPLFVDAARNDFRLSNSSPALGFGVSKKAVSGFEYLVPQFDILNAVRPNPIGSHPDAGIIENVNQLPKPSLLSIEGSDRKIFISWGQVTLNRLTRIKIYRSTSSIPDDATSGIITDTVKTSSTGYLDSSGLTNLTRYYYRIKFIDSSGIESSMSNEVSIRPNIPPPTVSNFKIDSGPSSINLSWDTINIVGASYNVYRSIDSSRISAALLAKGIKGRTYSDATIIKKIRYYYWVKSVDSIGAVSEFSNGLSASTIPNIYVSVNGSDLNNGSQNSPLRFISTAINLVNTLDTIFVDSGKYTESFNFQNKIFILKSLKGPDSTILSSLSDHIIRVGSTVNSPNESISQFREIYGFTISTKAANAIYTEGGTKLKITNCVFKENNVGYGAIHNNAVTTFQNCLFVDNSWALCLQGRDTTAYPGGEVFLNCVFTRNGTINTCAISGNWKPKFVNCIITGNNGGKSVLGAGYEVYNSIIDDDLYSKQPSNLNSDPLFMDVTRNDFRLQNTSPALGMGVSKINLFGVDYSAPKFDLLNSPRPNPTGSSPDLGIIENKLEGPLPNLDFIQKTSDTVLIKWAYPELSKVKQVIFYRDTTLNLDTSKALRRIINYSNQLSIRDTLPSSNLKYFYAIKLILNDGKYSPLSNVRAFNGISNLKTTLPPMVNARYLWGDIDADGDLDLAVMGETPGIFFQLYRNNNGTFVELFNRSQVPQLFKGTMKFADIDNDGDIDLIASGQKTTAINNLGTFLFKNDGTGNFTSSEMIDIVSTREGDMAFGDHDNDGDLDMALSGIDVNGQSRLTVYNNNSKGIFSIERRLFPSQGGPSDPLYSDLQWVDYDNDGDQDLIFSGRASGASAGIVTNTLFNGNQTNNFSGSNIRYYSEWALRNAAVETADLNADGWVDIIVSGAIENGANQTPQSRIIYGGSSGFQNGNFFILDNIAGKVRVADCDNDGDLDLLISGTDQLANPRTNFYLNIGTGSGFEKKSYEIIPNITRSAFSWADYDNDGDLDLVISGQRPASEGGQVISEVFSFEPEIRNKVPVKPAKPAIQNFGDGRLLVSWTPGSDDLTGSASLNYLLKIGTVSLSGIPGESFTVVEANKNGGTLLNPETGLIYGTKYFTQLNPGRYYFLLQVVDHNKLTSQPSDTLFLTLAYPWKFVNQGGIADATITANSKLSAKWGDIDRDNDYDFLYGNGVFESNKNNYLLSNYQFDEGYLLNNGGDQSLIKPNIKWHDVTQDGVPDLIVSSTESINPSNATSAKFRLNIFKNNPRINESGRGELTRLSLAVEDSIYLGNTRFKLTDLNNDGKPDILLAGVDKTTQSKVHVFTTGPLSSDKTSPPGFKFSRLSTNLDSILLAQRSYDLIFDFGDVDGDSDNDFVAFYKNDIGELISNTYLNSGINLTTGKITFVRSTTYVFDPLDNASIDLIDYDKDGDLDLLTSGRSFIAGPQFNIYESRNGEFVKITNPIQPFENAKLSFGDINNDGYSDLIYSGTREGSGLISKIAVYNRTTKGFGEQSQFLFGEEFNDVSIEFGDFDADSDLDILVNGILTGQNPTDIFRVYKNVQNESAKVLNALGTTTNSMSSIINQENIKTESSLERNFATVLNESVVSNVYIENNAPTVPINLKEQIISKVGDVFKVRFSWDAASDDNTPVEGLSYELKVGTTSGGSDAVVSQSLANGYRMVPEEGNTGRKKVWDIELKPGTYFWSAQSIDASYAGSNFAPEKQFTIDASGEICDASAPLIAYNGGINLCQGQTITLRSDKKQNIEWYLNDSKIVNATDSLLIVSATGSYKARYNNPGCISAFSSPLAITINPKPSTGTISAPATGVCVGQSITLTASSDSAYQWYRNDTPLPNISTKTITVNESGAYSFVSKVNGCISDRSPAVSITVSVIPTATFTMSSSAICEGSKVTLTASTGTGYTYQWLKNGINISGATSSTYSAGETGRYSVLISNNGCAATSTSDSLTVTPIPSKPAISKDGTELVSSSAAGNLWYAEGNLIAGANQQRYKPTNNGNYSAKVRTNGCESVMSETYYFLVTALVELGNDQYIKAYPNPLTSGQDLVIDWKLGGLNTTMKAEVFDPNGKKVADKVLTKNNNRLKINGGSGLYFIQLSWGDSQRQTIRVIKN